MVTRPFSSNQGRGGNSGAAKRNENQAKAKQKFEQNKKSVVHKKKETNVNLNSNRGSPTPIPPLSAAARASHGLEPPVRLPPGLVLSPRRFAADLLRVKLELLKPALSSLELYDVDYDDESSLDCDTMELLALEMGFETVRVARSKDQTQKKPDGTVYPPRPPVVSIMGHVDHGKTTLLDKLRYTATAAGAQQVRGKIGKQVAKTTVKGIRNSDEGSGNVAGTEAGGITQVITAFTVGLRPAASSSSDIDGATAGKQQQEQRTRDMVTFLDTPGHAAFKAMRANGSHATDIIVLVVAADDGVAAQTREVIALARDGGQHLVVAMSKIDKPGIDVQESTRRIQKELFEAGVVTEGMGGDVMIVPVSGVTGEGVDDLIEALVMQAEIMDLRADDNCEAEAIVIDARIDKGLGVVCECVVRWGKISIGDAVVSGIHGGKVRMMQNVDGRPTKEALPSYPIRIVGMKGLPNAGDSLITVATEELAKEITEKRMRVKGEASRVVERAKALPQTVQLSGGAARVFGRIAAKNTSVNAAAAAAAGGKGAGADEGLEPAMTRAAAIIKTDADGTLHAVKESLLGLSSSIIEIDVIHAAVGAVSASDVAMAAESGAVIFAFGVKANDREVLSLSADKKVKIRQHTIIYSLLDDAKSVFGEYLPPIVEDKFVGGAKILQVFELNGTRKQRKGVEEIGGCRITDGQMFLDRDARGNTCYYRIRRGGKDGAVQIEGARAHTLQKHKDKVGEVKSGEECGISFVDFTGLQPDDLIECYIKETVKQRL